MELNLSAEQRKRLAAFLESDEDCERLPGNEFVADLYEAQLLYDPELDAYYMGDPVEDTNAVVRALLRAMEGD